MTDSHSPVPGAGGPAGVPFRRLHPLTPVLRGWKVFAAAVAIATQQIYGELSLGYLLLGILASIPLGVLYGVVSWRTTRFRIDSEDLSLETGVLFRRSRRVRLDRLQAVDVVRPLVARALGLAELRLEVAGGSSSEAPLAYLGEGAAQQLRAELLARAAGLHHDTPEAPESVLVKVPLGRLVEGQLRSVALIGALVSLAVLMAVTIVTGEWSILGFAVPFAIATVPALARSVIVHFDFTVADSPDGLRLRHGLLETRAQTVPPGRVQAVRIIEPLLWRSKGWVRVEVNVAGYVGREGQSHSNVLLPVAPRAEAFAVLQRVLPDVDVQSIRTYGVPARARWCDPISWRGNAAGADDRVFVAKRGRLRREIDVVPHERVQSARLTQGPLQRRLGLATVHLDTSPGPVHPTAHHRDARDARDLLDAEVVLARRSRAVARPERWMRPPDHTAGPTVAR
ncbi:MAG: PH domain-containing protein [Actinomycetes bacterium]